MPARTAWTAAWMRLSRWSLARMLAMWLETVFALSDSSCAMSWLLSPLARRVKISSSRTVSAARMATAALWLLAVTRMQRSRPYACGGRCADVRQCARIAAQELDLCHFGNRPVGGAVAGAKISRDTERGMSQDNVEIVRNMYAAWACDEFSGSADLIDP